MSFSSSTSAPRLVRRLVRNDAVGREACEQPRRDAIALHRQLPGYAPTALRELPALAAELGVGAAYVKDETHRLGLPSFKIVGASWAAFCAVSERLGLDPLETSLERLTARLSGHAELELLTASAGNHGEAVAHVAKLLGIRAQVVVPHTTPVERIRAIMAVDGAVTVVDAPYDAAVERAAAWADDSRLLIADVALTPAERIPRRVVDGYETILRECDDQIPDPIDAVFVPAGVGSLAAAVVRHVRARDAPAWARDTRVVVVEPASANCVAASLAAGRAISVPADHPTSMFGMNCGRPSLVAWNDLRHGVDAAISILDADAARGIRSLGTHAIAAGACAGAGPGAALALADGLVERAGLDTLGLSSASSLLFLATEGASNTDAPTVSGERIGLG